MKRIITSEVTEQQGGEEWRTEVVWIDPALIDIDGSELHWAKISPDEARESFKAVERMRPYLSGATIQTEIDAHICRDRLAKIADSEGKFLFGDQDLRFFDAYFGDSHIRIEEAGGEYSVTNGRHRLWLARQEAIKAVPVFLQQRTTRQAITEVSTMSREIQDIEYEAKEEQEQADEMNKEIEQHKDRVERLNELVQQFKGQDIQSDELRHAEVSAERAKQETEHRLTEIKEKKEKLLEENQQLAQTILKANEGRSQAMGKVAMMEAVSSDAPGEIRAMLQSIQDSLHLDQGHLARAESELVEARKKLEAMDV